MRNPSSKFATKKQIMEWMETETCPICLKPPTAPVTTKCGHLFCEFCIYKWLQDDKKPCPTCRAPLVFNKEKGIIRPTFICTSVHSPSSSEVGMSTGEDDDTVPNMPGPVFVIDLMDDASPENSLSNDEVEEDDASPENSLPNDEVESSCSNHLNLLHHDEGDPSVDSSP